MRPILKLAAHFTIFVARTGNFCGSNKNGQVCAARQQPLTTEILWRQQVAENQTGLICWSVAHLATATKIADHKNCLYGQQKW